MKENKTFLYLIIILMLISVFSSLYYFSVTSKKLNEITSKIDGLKKTSEPTSIPTPPPAQPQELKIGDKSPLFRMLSLDGKWYSLHQYRDKKNVILLAWVVACPQCKKILEKFNTLFKELNKNEVELLSVTYSGSEEEKKEIMKFVGKEKIDFPVLLSTPNDSFGLDYKITVVPVVWVINKKGEISKIHKSQELEEKDLKEIFKEFLK